MAVGFRVDFLWYPVGHGDFVHAFFSTVSYHLELNGWGSNYPLLMNHLYQGKLNWNDVPQAIQEVQDIREKLKAYTPDQVIWDLEDVTKQPPWKNDIAPTITNLSNYFVTSDGRDMFDVLLAALQDATDEKIDLEIATI